MNVDRKPATSRDERRACLPGRRRRIVTWGALTFLVGCESTADVLVAVPTEGATSTMGATLGGASVSTTSDVPPSDDPCVAAVATGHFQMEALDRGLVAVAVEGGVYVGWRMFGYEYWPDSPAAVSYRVYRDDVVIAHVEDSTNLLDVGGTASSRYRVSAQWGELECPPSPAVSVWDDQVLTIPLQPPPPGMTPVGEAYAYDVATIVESEGSVADGSPGDLDGDGAYELVVVWMPSNVKDNGTAGHTGPVYVDAYELNGTRLWRLDLGPNVRAGAHYVQFVVYDFDGDGRAEIAMRTAPGTHDGTGEFLRLGPAAEDDDAVDYRNADGYVLEGPEYLTIFEGTTGRELATVPFEVPRGDVAAWGDDYGNYADRFLASAAFLGDRGDAGEGSGRPALVMARGYYERSTLTAWTWRDGELSRLWTLDSAEQGIPELEGQGAYSMAVADVDGDRAQEIVFGAAMVQSDGTFGCSTGLGRGDALHAGDFIPERPGLEVFMPHESTDSPWWDLRDAATCEIIHVSTSSGRDNGRGVAADILADAPGAEFWSAADDELRNAVTGEALGPRPAPINFVVWWDADELREILDLDFIDKGDGTRLLTCDECASNNWTKATPTLTGDLFGDWREEIVWRTPTSDALRIYTTTEVTRRRLYTLMHDPQYRMQVTSEMTGYNQPPHVGFFLGVGMADPPRPDIHVR